MSVNIKLSKRIVAWLLTVMLFMGAISLQPVYETVRAVYEEQKAWQEILDADLQQDTPVYEDAGEPSELTRHDRRTDFAETNDAIRADYAVDLIAETEAYMADRFIVKYKAGASVPKLSENSALRSKGVTDIESIDSAEREVSSRFAVISMDAPKKVSELRQTMKDAQLDNTIEYIQPDYAMAMATSENATGISEGSGRVLSGTSG